MSSVDERVVRAMFDNSQFEQGVATTLTSLEKLNKGLQLQGATKGLDDVSAAAKGFSLGNIASGVSGIADKFKALSVIGVTALASITTKAVDAGVHIAKALTLDPIKAGFENYETQIKAVQTILANTQAEGTKLGDVNKVLAQLNTYANQTVYNFSDMTKNIGTFTAAGVGLKQSAESIKGIANLAALSGSNSEQASTAMYQLSQAIAAGSVKLQDWNSVVNAGLGGKTFQTALENTARASGVSIDKIIKKAGSFRESLQEGWLTSDVLTKTLSQFTGDLSQKQIQAMGYTAAQAKEILKTGQTAVDAATKIKTMSQLTDALKEEVATAWATIFKTIFGGIGQATTLFSGIHTVAENALTKPIYALNTLLEGVDKLGGRTKVIDTLKNVFEAFGSVLKPIGNAFRDIFPPSTAEGIEKIITDVDDFSKKLVLSSTTADELRRTFAGIFAVLGIGWDIIKEVAKSLFDLFTTATSGSSSILKITARIGDFLVSLHDAIEQGDGLEKFFSGLTKVLSEPILLLKSLGDYVESMFSKFDGAKAEKAVTGVTDKLTPMEKLAHLTAEAWQALAGAIDKLWAGFQPIADKIETFFNQLANAITTDLLTMNFDDVINLINVGLLGGITLIFKKFVDKFHSDSSNPATGLVHGITESFEELTKTLKTMQGTLKAATLLEIAIAIGILTVSVAALSKIDSDGLKRSLAAMAVMFGELLTSMGIFQKVVGTTGFAKVPIIAGAFILLAIAIDLLTIAVKKLSELDWNDLAKGMTGLSVILGLLVATIKLMPPASGMISTGLGLIALAGAVNLLVTAVTDLAGLSWSEIAKGLTGVAGLLVSLALFTKFSAAGKTGVLQGAGIILLATGIKILAGAMKQFAQFSWTDIGKGLASIAGGLGLIAAALYLLPPSSLLSAAGILVVASSLGLIGDAIEKMGGFSWSTIGKGLATLAGALVLIAAALYVLPPESLLSAAAIFVVAASLGLIADALQQMGNMSWSQIGKSIVELAAALTLISAATILMTEALPGAAAILVVAAALAILTPVLQAMGDMSWEEIGKGLLTLAGVFVILGVAGALLTPVVPTLIGLGAAITLLGIGMLAAGAGLLLFSTSLTALAVAGAAGAAAIVGIVASLLGILPLVAKEIGLAVIAFAKTISTSGTAITKAMTTVIEAIITAIVILTPKVVTALLKLLLQFLQALVNYVPKLITAGSNLVAGVLNGIAKNAGKLATAGANLVIAFINAISKQLPKVATSGANLVIHFINTVASTIRKESGPLGAAGGNLASAIIEGIIKGLANGAASVASHAASLGKSAINAAAGALHINSPSKDFIKIGESTGEGAVVGIDNSVSDVKKSAANLGNSAISAMGDTLSNLSDVVGGDIDMTPIITPVLDLTDVKKNASSIANMLTTAPISVGSTYSSAKAASAGYASNQEVLPAADGTTPEVSPLTFNQYNNSPKALTSAEIYRQTKNQLSVAKSKLSTAKGALTSV